MHGIETKETPRTVSPDAANRPEDQRTISHAEGEAMRIAEALGGVCYTAEDDGMGGGDPLVVVGPTTIAFGFETVDVQTVHKFAYGDDLLRKIRGLLGR